MLIFYREVSSGDSHPDPSSSGWLCAVGTGNNPCKQFLFIINAVGLFSFQQHLKT
ncbi:MAG: hypothetical protein R6W78_10120 [Bacteroidales bacterium]